VGCGVLGRDPLSVYKVLGGRLEGFGRENVGGGAEGSASAVRLEGGLGEGYNDEFGDVVL
jgi:hypothetical protein